VSTLILLLLLLARRVKSFYNSTIRATLSFVAGLALLGVVVLAGGARATAEGGAFTATAAADGTRVTVTIRNAPLADSPVDGGGPSAQAQLTSAGTSTAFASAPYPGDTAINLPGTAAGFGVPGVPSYPLYLQTTYPLSPKGSVNQGPYHLTASSDPQQSQADALIGTDSNGASAATHSTASTALADDGSVTATAKAISQALAVGTLRLGSVTSTATMHLKTDGTLERTTALDITGLSVGGVSVGFGPNGFTVAGTTVPFPNGDQLTSLLAAQKTAIAYLQPVNTDHGEVAPAVQITTVQNVPGQNPANIVLTVGRATASIEGVAVPKDTPPAAAGLGITTGTPAGDVASSAPTGSAPVADTPSVAGSIAGTPRSPLSAAPITRVARRQSIDHLGGPSIYLVVVGGGLVALGLTQAMSQLGVRLRWSS
jgi:hypothetical protein